jgi:AraC-like DNA-binding protein
VVAIQQVIQQHANDPSISLDLVAVMLRVSPSLVSHRLGTTDCGFWSRVHTARINRAVELLDTPNLPIKATASWSAIVTLKISLAGSVGRPA